MAALMESLLSEAEERALYARLAAYDNVAFSDLAKQYLGSLIHWLTNHNRATVPEDMLVSAAEDALIALAKSPSSFDPAKKRLEPYLRMSAQGDLKNALAREKRHRLGRMNADNVELSREAGKYLQVDDDPSLPLQIREEQDRARNEVSAKVRDRLPDGELRFLALMEQSERKTALFAQALGIEHLPKEEKAAIVKRTKDKLKKRLERGACRDDHAP